MDLLSVIIASNEAKAPLHLFLVDTLGEKIKNIEIPYPFIVTPKGMTVVRIDGQETKEVIEFLGLYPTSDTLGFHLFSTEKAAHEFLQMVIEENQYEDQVDFKQIENERLLDYGTNGYRFNNFDEFCHFLETGEFRNGKNSSNK